MKPDPSGARISPPISIRIHWRCSSGARLEPALADAKPELPVQFERQGYFCLDPASKPERLIFARTIGLRDTWAKDQAKDQAKEKAAG